jgi:hypothetical protein
VEQLDQEHQAKEIMEEIQVEEYRTSICYRRRRWSWCCRFKCCKSNSIRSRWSRFSKFNFRITSNLCRWWRRWRIYTRRIIGAGRRWRWCEQE